MRENYLNLVFKPTDKNASTLKLSFRPSHQTCDERAVEPIPSRHRRIPSLEALPDFTLQDRSVMVAIQDVES